MEPSVHADPAEAGRRPYRMSGGLPPDRHGPSGGQGPVGGQGPWSGKGPSGGHSPARGNDGPEGRSPAPMEEWLQQRLFDQRVVLLQGSLDSVTASRVAAQLVALDALGGHRITMHMNSADGDLEAALLLMDTMDALHVPVHAIATGSVGGAVLGVLAAAGQRSAFPHARFLLTEPRAVEQPAGNADELAAWSTMQEEMLGALVRRLARIALKAPANVRRDLTEGRFLTAGEAVEYGLVQAVTGAADTRQRPGSGFAPGADSW
jgi:ATP-dependent Clp protease, protease subunit